MLVSQIIATLEEQAPLALQEDYDNSGLIVGAPAQECTGALLTVDVTPDIVREVRIKVATSSYPTTRSYSKGSRGSMAGHRWNNL